LSFIITSVLFGVYKYKSKGAPQERDTTEERISGYALNNVDPTDSKNKEIE
jgi:hypothetical protein